MAGTAVEVAAPLVPSFGMLGFLLIVNVALFIRLVCAKAMAL